MASNIDEILLNGIRSVGNYGGPSIETVNVENIVTAVDSGELLHLHCFVHTLNLDTQEVLKSQAVGPFPSRILA